MDKWTGVRMDLQMFDGEGAAGAAAPAGGEAAESAQSAEAVPEAEHRRASGRMRPGERKPPEEPAAGSDAGSGKEAAAAETAGKTAGQEAQPAPQDRKAAFEQLIRGEYKQEFTDYFNERFGQRYNDEIRSSRERIAALEPLLGTLAERYGVEDKDPQKVLQALGADETLWRDKAREAGMTTAQYMQVEQLKQANRQLAEQAERARGEEAARKQYQAWIGEAESLKEIYPEFDMVSELGDERFRRMLTNGFPMKNVYESLHHEELTQRAVAQARREAERQVTDNIRARGARPSENGTGAQRGSISASDVHKMTRKQRQEIARRMLAGEDPGF